VYGDTQVKKARSNFAESFSHCPVTPEEATMVDLRMHIVVVVEVMIHHHSLLPLSLHLGHHHWPG